jgi:hypothetical protein
LSQNESDINIAVQNGSLRQKKSIPAVQEITFISEPKIDPMKKYERLFFQK